MFKKSKLSIALWVVFASMTLANDTENIIKNHHSIFYATKKDVHIGITLGKDKTYGIDLEFNNLNNRTGIVIQKSKTYKKAAVTTRQNINKDVYVKGGLGKLKKDEVISWNTTEVTQDTYWVAVGMGDEKTYNVEAWVVRNKLSGAGWADGNADTTYIEWVIANDDYEGLATVKNTKVFDKSHTNYSVEAGYKYNDDCKVSIKHDSIKHDDSGTEFYVWAEYSFNWDDITNGEWNSKVKVTNNIDEHTSASLECGNNNRSLKDRDEFENAMETANITAKQVDSEGFNERTKEVVETPTSTPQINSLWTITIDDDGGLTVRSVGTVSWTNINTWAVYSIVNDPSSWLSINSSTWVMTWQWNEWWNQSFTITIKVKNTDGWEDTETFTLNVNDTL